MELFAIFLRELSEASMRDEDSKEEREDLKARLAEAEDAMEELKKENQQQRKEVGAKMTKVFAMRTNCNTRRLHSSCWT